MWLTLAAAAVTVKHTINWGQALTTAGTIVGILASLVGGTVFLLRWRGNSLTNRFAEAAAKIVAEALRPVNGRLDDLDATDAVQDRRIARLEGQREGREQAFHEMSTNQERKN